jgi:site-specific DNA recombinase
MIAAVYARKSTEQNGVADDQRSVTRQVGHAREYAERKGWTVDTASIFVDDGISGAEFANRPGFLRLMNALKPRPAFQVLVMSEESRLGREAIETAYALKQLVQAGVRVFFYMEDRERTLDSPTDKIMLSLTAFADELEREKARQRTYDAMLRKAKAGHVCGGKTFGYSNVEIARPDGKRSHVERRINDAEAEVVRRIFELCSAGVGQTRIAKQLNADRAIAPRAQRGRPQAWAPSSVHEVLFRDLYRGVLTWNQTRKRNRWGQHQQTARPAGDWLRVPAPQLRIVSDDLWLAAHRRLETARAQYERDTHGERRPRRDRDSRYLLPGFGRCALCRGGLHVRTRAHGRKRAFFYACTSHYNRGPEICPHVDQWPMDEIDRSVLAKMAGDVLNPDLAEEIVQTARELYVAPAPALDDRDQLRHDLDMVEREQARLTDALAAGADVPVLVERLRTTERRRQELITALVPRTTRQAPAWDEIERRVRVCLADWRSMITGDVAEARQGFRRLLSTPILFTPFVRDGKRGLRFEGRIGQDALLGGEVTKLASPTGVAPSHVCGCNPVAGPRAAAGSLTKDTGAILRYVLPALALGIAHRITATDDYGRR